MEGRADFIVAETFGEFGEAMLALECIKEYGNGNERVIKININQFLTVTVKGMNGHLSFL